MKKDGNFGLSTYDALGILYDEIESLLEDHCSVPRSRWYELKKLFSHCNEHSSVSWISQILVFLCSFILILVSLSSKAVDEDNFLLEGIILNLIGLGNIVLALWDDRLRLREVPDKINNLLIFIRECQEKCLWEPENYPHLCSPYSPCIALQWTYRDHKLVNLPWALLVRGDIILLRPGQPSPGAALPQECGGTPLGCGEVYCPPERRSHISQPTARTPLPNKRFVLQETPVLRNMRDVLARASRCPVTRYDRQRHLVVTRVVFNILLPILVGAQVIISIGTSVIAQKTEQEDWQRWASTAVRPVGVALPLLPLALPVAWLALNTLGYARISAHLQAASVARHPPASDDPFEEVSIKEEVEETSPGVGVQWVQHLFHSLLGRQHSFTLARTVNPLHVIGSVSALCCVDKKGILSWPNPTAEKVFFLRTAPNKSSAPSEISHCHGDNESTGDEHSDDEAVFADVSGDEKAAPAEKVVECVEGRRTVVEVLDVTHDATSPFRLHWDDARWRAHLASLKPLGLAILLNTCHAGTHDRYLHFCSHVAAEAIHSDHLVPVTNRSSKGFKCLSCVKEVSTLLSNNKCLCELSKQIGFSDDVTKNFKLLEQLSTFRHVKTQSGFSIFAIAAGLAQYRTNDSKLGQQAEAVRRDGRLGRTLGLATKLKLPFPHMVSVVVAEAAAPGALQLFSQATGDLTLDACVDFWDGSTLRLLSPADRKKVIDFYQRTSLTGYCTAFGYRPLTRGVSHTLSNVYMELPADSHALYLAARSPTPAAPPLLSQSTDSLFGAEFYDEDASDIDDCFDLQCNQIFLGMVTMQYQAQSEMVQLIEQLERACIRFVHFSKENELRSRVFSEKMGLESGWNCHISLLSSEPTVQQTILIDDEQDQEDKMDTPLLEINNLKRGSLEGTKNISASAPCAINIDVEKGGRDRKSILEEAESGGAQEGWQSLSCVSDSTEQSVPLDLLDNKAKLPRGIEAIRPHLEQVDNVPLLVSLFTDCTPATTRQMVAIMQDYGEVVLVMGSSASADNCSIFLAADASVAVEPLYPQVCQKVPVLRLREDCGVPTQLGQRLNALPCSVAATRQRPVSLYHLIMHCRHYMQCLWNSIQFFVCCCIGISVLQVVSSLLLVPPVLSIGLIEWLVCGVVPCLSLSLVFRPPSAKVMQRPGHKTHSSINYEGTVFSAWCYGCKVAVTAAAVPGVFVLTLGGNCPPGGGCAPGFAPAAAPWPTITISAAQHFAAALLVLHLVTMSASFVYRDKMCWHKSPFHNKVWAVTSAVMIIGQIVMAWAEGGIYLPLNAILVGVLSPIAVLLVNETVKWHEIKANVRNEKRARLEFGTKLGMNSPF